MRFYSYCVIMKKKSTQKNKGGRDFMSKRKELILKTIYAHTLECLEDKQYDKLGMDASSLAMDLRLDR